MKEEIIIAGFGGQGVLSMGKILAYSGLMEDKEVYTSKDNKDMSMPITKNDNGQRQYNSQVVYPIISNGDTIGSVILMSKDANVKMTDVEKKVAQSAATFLGSQMEI